MSKIERLTPEQEAMLPVYRDKWLKIGLDTSSCDRPQAEHWMSEIYRQADLVKPSVIWAESPLACIYTIQILHQVRGQVWDQVGGQVWDQVGGQVRDQVGDQVWGQVWDQVGGQVGDQVWNNWIYGSHDAAWLSYYDFFRTECNLSCCDSILPFIALAQNCGWCLPFQGLVIASEKPDSVAITDGVLHCETGPAIHYRGGFGVWALNGRRMPQRIVETPVAEIPLEWWAEEPNVEVRLAIEKKIGSERILSELDGGIVDQELLTIQGSDIPYELLRFTFPNSDTRIALRMTNVSTGSVHTEWVPPTIATCRGALSWRNGCDQIPEYLT